MPFHNCGFTKGKKRVQPPTLNIRSFEQITKINKVDSNYFCQKIVDSDIKFVCNYYCLYNFSI